MRLTQLVERVQDDLLYHSTALSSAISLLTQRVIMPAGTSSGKPAISFTRNIRYVYNDGSVRLVIDRAVLAHNHKIVPFDYIHSTMSPAEIADEYADMDAAELKEQEERVFQPVVVDNRMVKEIQVIRANLVQSDTPELQQLVALAKDLNIPIKAV